MNKSRKFAIIALFWLRVRAHFGQGTQGVKAEGGQLIRNIQTKHKSDLNSNS